MDGGENTMVKKFIFSVSAVFFALPLIFCASAQAEIQDGNEDYYYEEYDNYNEMEQDYIDSEVVDKASPKQSAVFIPAIILGAAAGLGVTHIVLKAVFSPPAPDPYFRKAEAKHEIVNKADTKIG